jgi:Na+(H+)/acetate symporter ActP
MFSDLNYWILAFSTFTVMVTIWMGFRSARTSKTNSDFFVAGRSVSVGWNAAAISGEYLSAASFMGVAGMVMAYGYDALWYPVGYACGYLFLLLFIAGPLRRFGAYTIPDFAEGRFDSPLFRKIAVVFVLFIGFFYTLPQMKGAGTTLSYIFPGMPYWAGVVLVGSIITLNVVLGGMKGITLVQAFQYWLKLFAISVPIFVMLSIYGGYGKQLEMNQPSVVEVRSSESELRPLLPEQAPEDDRWLTPFGRLTTKAALASRSAQAASPATDANADSSISNQPVTAEASISTQERRLALLYTYSLIVALVCGTAGLPHILVRFYTNPDGGAAKRTTMWVMILIGLFYVFPPIFGVLGRNLVPELYAGVGTKGTDKVVLEVPTLLNERIPHLGSILSGITCAGAFAAFMSTFSGLLVSMTGALAHDIYGRILHPTSTAGQRLRMFKWAAVLVGLIATLLGTMVEPLQINFLVGQAFAIAAASYFPLLFMSIWWRGMTATGAATGMLTGGLTALGAIALTNMTDLKWLPLDSFWAAHPVLRILCEQPAIWSVPLAIGLMIIVSRLTSQQVPVDIRQKMLVLHAPEELGLKDDYIKDHAGH